MARQRGYNMATKINETIWGDVPATGGALRVNRSLRDLITAGLYDPETGNFNMSVSPWGIGYSNAGNFSIPWYTRTGEAASTSGNRINKIGCENSKSYNTPFLMGYGIYGLRESYTDEYIKPMQRIFGGTTKDNDNYIVSTVKYDLGDKPPSYHVSASDSVANLKPVLYLDYQSIKIVTTALQWINLINGTITRTVLSNPTQYNAYTTAVNSMDLENIGIIAIEYQIYVKTNGSWGAITADNGYMIHNFKKFKVTDRLKQFYFSGDETDYVQIMPRGYIGAPYKDASWSSNGGRNMPMESYSYGELANYHSFDNTFDWTDFAGKSAGRFTVGSWSFEDNDYSTDVLSFWGGTNPIRELHENDIISYSGYIRTCSVTRITRTTAPRNSTAINTVISHELAFFGLPFVNGWSTNAETQNIGDTDVYLPVFDEHMLTTGRYVRGNDSLELPNALWGDVFSDTMPDYDPTYKPPTPETPENDSGALDNSIYRNIRLGGSNYFYALNETELHNFINFVNGLYLGDADDTQLKIDFKGSNPNDYIVGVFAYPFNIPNVAHASNIYLGCVESTVNANVVRQTDVGHFTFGSLTVDENNFDFLHGDFRDYAPYTQIELYIPLCGTVELDAAFYVGHTITVDGIYDINTGSLTMRVLRDNIVDRTFDASIAVQIPITSRNMGDYQNNIHQMRMNLINASIGGVQTAEKTVTCAIAQSQSNNPLSGLSESGFDIGASGFAAGQAITNAKYQLSHIQPRPCMTSTSSSANAIQMYNKCILFVKRAKMISGFSAETYGKTVGYACLKNTTLSDSDISGFTICSDCDLSGIPATADEINAIQNALHNGIYV